MLSAKPLHILLRSDRGISVFIGGGVYCIHYTLYIEWWLKIPPFILSSLGQFFAINAKIENIVFLITLKVKKVFL